MEYMVVLKNNVNMIVAFYAIDESQYWNETSRPDEERQ